MMADAALHIAPGARLNPLRFNREGTMDENQKGAPRSSQTKAIIIAAVVALGGFYGYDAVMHPNLDGMQPYEKCDFFAFYRTHGGSKSQCKTDEALAASARLRDRASGLPNMSDDKISPEVEAELRSFSEEADKIRNKALAK